jgi:ferredoxin
MQALIFGRAVLRPQADAQKCTGCGACVGHCPISVLFMVENIPRVNADICIACFCCQEMCPEKAITLR